MNNYKKKLKIGMFSPYLNILGGGERYLLTIAENLGRKHEVFLFSRENIREKAKSVFNITLDRVHFLPEETIRTKNLFRKYISLLNFNVFFYMTDGSLFFPVARKNFLIIQSPVHIPRLSLMNKLKLVNWDVLCYSQFMEKIISDRLRKEAKILSPCIDTEMFRNKFEDKKNIILTVGRFFPYPHSKKHDFLVKVFKKNYDKYFKSWRLIVIGGLTEKGGEEVLHSLRKTSVGYPIEILVNLPYNDLNELYNKARIYWHAAGFGEDIEDHPERVEHFGITTLEAMAAGVVPIVFDAGGQQEIVEDGKNGYFWSIEEGLMEKTSQLINNTCLLNTLSKQAQVKATDFSCEKFYGKLEKILS